MATPYEDWLRMQSGMPPPRQYAPAPVMPRSPYLTPQMSEQPWGLPFPTSLMGAELPGSAPVPPAEEAAPAPTTPMGGGFAGGFAPASQTLPRQIERGRGPFDDFMATYNATRSPTAGSPSPPEASPFGPAPQPEQAAPFMLQGPQSPRQGGYGGGGMGGGIGGMDEGQMRREAMLASRFPRAMARVQQLRGMSQRRGY